VLSEARRLAYRDGAAIARFAPSPNGLITQPRSSTDGALRWRDETVPCTTGLHLAHVAPPGFPCSGVDSGGEGLLASLSTVSGGLMA
jgi:hypothetical protein